MPTQKVTLEDGTVKTVVADDAADLQAAVDSVKNQTSVDAFDINVPVRKGHDLLRQDEDLNVVAVDGTGGHNSPRDAVRDDGTIEGSDPLYVVPSAVVAHAVDQKELVKDGELKDVSADEVASSVSAADKDFSADASTVNTEAAQEEDAKSAKKAASQE